MSAPHPSLPTRLNLGSGKRFMPDWLNIDVNPLWRPDIVADFNHPFPPERPIETDRFGVVTISPGSFTEIKAHDVLEHLADVVMCMTNCLHLLDFGGVMDIRVPYDLSYGAWQDPTHVRAFNERSWLYFTEEFWYIGWSAARFDLEALTMVPSDFGKELYEREAPNGMTLHDLSRTPRAVEHMDVRLVKIHLTEKEKTKAAGRYARG